MAMHHFSMEHFFFIDLIPERLRGKKWKQITDGTEETRGFLSDIVLHKSSTRGLNRMNTSQLLLFGSLSASFHCFIHLDFFFFNSPNPKTLFLSFFSFFFWGYLCDSHPFVHPICSFQLSCLKLSATPVELKLLRWLVKSIWMHHFLRTFKSWTQGHVVLNGICSE